MQGALHPEVFEVKGLWQILLRRPLKHSSDAHLELAFRMGIRIALSGSQHDLPPQKTALLQQGA